MKYFGMLILSLAFIFVHCEDGTDEKGTGSKHQFEEQYRDSSQHQQKESEQYEIVKLNAEKLQMVNVSYDTLHRKNLSETIETNGHVHLAPNYRSMISTLIGGRVKRINIIEGDYVQNGETLALLESMAITQLQQEYLSNKAEIPYLKKEYERKKRLLDERVGAASELQKAKAEYESTLAEIKAQEENLKMLGIFEYAREGKISPTVSITAPFNGHIGDVQITRGQFMEPHQPLVEILNTNKAHLELQVYEKNIGKVEEGQTVLFKYANQPRDWIRGKIFRVGKKYHKETQSIRVHAHIHKSEEITIIPGVYVTARIQVKTGETYALPEEGVIRDGKKTYVFAPVSELEGTMNDLKQTPGEGERFVRIGVNASHTDGGFTSIQSFKQDIPMDIQFVTNGASSLQAEMKKSAGGGHH